MIRKSERPFNFTDRQIAHLKHIHPRLRTLNRYAICELRRIGWAILTDAPVPGYRQVPRNTVNSYEHPRAGSRWNPISRPESATPTHRNCNFLTL
jgi:hypothetical protein